MRTSTLIFFFFSSFFLTAQENYSIDIVSGIGYSHYYANYNSSSPSQILSLGTWNTTSGGLGWRFGLNYNKRIGLDYLFKTGINVSSHNFVNDDQFDYEIDASYNFWFVELPIAIRREMESRTFSPFVEFGLAPTVLIGNKIEVGQGFVHIDDNYKDNMPTVELLVILSGGFNYNINSEWDAFAQPTFRYHILGIEIWEDYKQNFYSFGLDVGMRRLF